MHEISNNVICATSLASDQPAHLSLEYSMNVKLMTEHHLEFLSLKEGYTGWSESTLLKMPHCWKSHATARILYSKFLLVSLAELVGLSLTCFQTMKARFFSQPGLKCQDNCSRQINADVFPYLEHKILDIYSI